MPTATDEQDERHQRSEGKEPRRRRVRIAKASGGERAHRSSQGRARDRSDDSNSDRGSTGGASTSTVSPRRVSAPARGPSRQTSSLSMEEGPRISLPYPAFSKAHSREAVRSVENLDGTGSRRGSTEAPDDKRRRSGKTKAESKDGNPRGSRTPSRKFSHDAGLSDKKTRAQDPSEGKERQSEETKRDGLQGRKATVRLSNSSLRDSNSSKTQSSTRRVVSHNTPRKKSYRYRSNVSHDEDDSSLLSDSRSSSPVSRHTDSVTKPTVTSSADAAAIPKPPAQQQDQEPVDLEAGMGKPQSRTSTPRGDQTPAASRPETVVPEVYQQPSAAFSQTTIPRYPAPQPPPPPPPPMMHLSAPRVDYLMQNGGLSRKVVKQYLDAVDSGPARPFGYGNLPDSSLMALQAKSFFRPFSDLLDGYSNVMEKNGSLAVATGYRSIARRLLDRLEAVFARDISSETCECAMCEHNFPPDRDEPDPSGISWGEILEFVSGRRELPRWPPFALTDTVDTDTVGLGILETPMQKLDIDVPDEYREHYIKQSMKTKLNVDRWLAGQAVQNTAPADADDDTLTFAMLTRLDDIQRPYFKKLLGMTDTRPPSVQPVQPVKPDDGRPNILSKLPDTPLIERTGFALKRLYRLANQPRAPESVCYLVCNPQMHDVLATLAAVSDHEWDVLTSGRFDGFLWSGAEDQTPPVMTPSRGSTPANGGRVSRGPTPLPRPNTPMTSAGGPGGGAPVALDEETEIAVLAEVERDIFLGMEALEDAFEELHQRAEAVRATLRTRGAGLAMAQVTRRGAAGDTIEARLGTPASQMGTPRRGQWDGNGAGDDMAEDGNDDGASVFGAEWRSELAPDDSASNISGVRKFRRKKRVDERRTPAPIEEEDDDAESYSRTKVRDRHRDGRRR